MPLVRLRPVPAASPLRVLLLLAPPLLAGCTAYEPRPLRLDAHGEEFLHREPLLPAAGGAVAPPPFDPSDGLSVEEGEALGLVFNTSLRRARLAAGVTAATAANAGLWEDPVIGVDVTRILESGAQAWEAFGTVGLTIPISGRLEAEKRRAGAAHAAELCRVAAEEWTFRERLRSEWLRWSALHAACAVDGESLALLSDLAAIVERLEEAGEVPRIEGRLFRLQRELMDAALEARRAEREHSRLRLLRMMGLGPASRLQPVPLDLAPTAGPPAAPLTAADVAANPRLAAAMAAYQESEDALALEVREQYPDLNLGGGYGTQDGQRQALIGVSLPVPILNANRRGVAEATARRELARAEAESLQEELLSELASERQAWEVALRRRERLETGSLPLAEAQYADARALARLGEVKTLVLLESLERRRQVLLDVIDARRDEALAGVRCGALAGPATGGDR